MEFLVQRAGARSRLEVVRESGALRITRDGGAPLHVTVINHDESSLLLEIDGQRHRVRWARRGDELHLVLAGHTARFGRVDEEHAEDLDIAAGSPVVRAPMPGRVLEVLVEVGQQVRAGQPVARVEAMKMEVALPSAVDGTVSEVHVAADALVQPDQALVTITPHEAS